MHLFNFERTCQSVPFGGLQAGREGGTTEWTVLEIPATTATWRPVLDGGRPTKEAAGQLAALDLGCWAGAERTPDQI